MNDIEPDVWLERASGRSDRRPGDHRPEVERDRSRILHSAGFRRLQGKTQVLGISESDFHRTRLTHSLEVAQISRGITYELGHRVSGQQDILDALPEIPVIETISFGHDLGHPPFGHSGEIALNYVMRATGGFEGNGQSLRLLSHLEPHTRNHGLDLTRRVLLGILKYPAPYSRVVRTVLPREPKDATQLVKADWKPPKCYLDCESEVVDWILSPLTGVDRDLFTSLEIEPTPEKHGKTKYKSFHASIMELADDIAYGTHDFEDAVALGLVTQEHWSEVLHAVDMKWASQFDFDLDSMAANLFDRRRGLRTGRRKQVIGAIINALVSSVNVVAQADFESSMLRYNAYLEDPARRFLKALTDAVFTHVVLSQPVQTLEYRGRHMIVSMFEALKSDWKSFLNPAFSNWIEEHGNVDRGVCDYIAGMTDPYADRVYERLFVPRQGSLFEKL
jgi:dGTPase